MALTRTSIVSPYGMPFGTSNSMSATFFFRPHPTTRIFYELPYKPPPRSPAFASPWQQTQQVRVDGLRPAHTFTRDNHIHCIFSFFFEEKEEDWAFRLVFALRSSIFRILRGSRCVSPLSSSSSSPSSGTDSASSQETASTELPCGSPSKETTCLSNATRLSTSFLPSVHSQSWEPMHPPSGTDSSLSSAALASRRESDGECGMRRRHVNAA